MNRSGGLSLMKKVSSLGEEAALKEQGRLAFIPKKEGLFEGKAKRNIAGTGVYSSQSIKGGLAVVSGKPSPGTKRIRGRSPSSQGQIGTKVAKVGKTLGNLGRKAVSTIKTTVVSNKGTHFVRGVAPRSATLCSATFTLFTFLGSIFLVTSTVAVGYLTYIGIKDLFGRKKR